jgi:hypothetical protein
VVNPCKPHGLGVTSHQYPLMTWPPQLSRLVLGFEAQPRNRTRLRLAVLVTIRLALDPTGHRVPLTKPTCLIHTWMPTGIDLSRLFFTCTNTNQYACTCNTWLRVSPHNVVNHSSHQVATIHWSSNHTGPQTETFLFNFEPDQVQLIFQPS